MMKHFIIIIVILLAFIQVRGQNAIEVSKVETIPFRDVNSPVWQSAEAVKVQLMPQNIIAPVMNDASVDNFTVRAITDGKFVAFLMEWDDDTKNCRVEVDHFSDQVAIQLPVGQDFPPSFMMGNYKGRVHIAYWKAAWQKDMEEGYQGTRQLHPNFWVDMYHFKDNTDLLAIDTDLTDFTSTEAKNYLHAYYTGNPIVKFDRKEPVGEGIAEGYGTLTAKKEYNSRAWGEWKDGKWQVIIAMPVTAGDETTAPLDGDTHIAFAVWNGEERNIGARKHYTMWVPLKF